VVERGTTRYCMLASSPLEVDPPRMRSRTLAWLFTSSSRKGTDEGKGDRRMQIHRRTDCQSVLQSLRPGYISICRSPKDRTWDRGSCRHDPPEEQRTEDGRASE